MPKAKVSKNFKVNIPQKVRLALNINCGDYLFFNIEGSKVFLFNGGQERKPEKQQHPEKSENYVLKLRQEWKEKEKRMGL